MKKTLLLFSVLLLVIALTACAKAMNNHTQRTNSPTISDYNSVNNTDNTPTAGLVTDKTVKSNAEPQTEIPAPDNQTERQNTFSSKTTISSEQAVEIALANVGLTRNSVYDLEVEFDIEHNGSFWEVEFETKLYEYSFDIDAESGAIVHLKTEKND